MLRRLNHAVLYVRDAEKSAEFYEVVLGFETVAAINSSAFFLVAPGSGNSHDLGLFTVGADAATRPPGRPAVGLYHLAWEVDTLADLKEVRERLSDAAALVGESDHGESKSLYGRDLDEIEFEIMWEVPRELLRPGVDDMKVERLDWDATIARFGLTTSRNS